MEQNNFKRCLLEESKAISQASVGINDLEIENAINILYKCSKAGKKLLVTGVGKSGIVARKIAATFSSVGLTALYLNPLDALHGDLGIVSEKDVCILLSNSGETEELLLIMPHLKLRKISTIAIVGNNNSSLAKDSNVILTANVDKEICPLNLAPTASTSVSMAIGDALAVVWMEKCGISSEDFAFNHPAGQLGKKITLSVKDIMIDVKKIKGITINTEIQEIILEMTKIGSGFIWINDDDDKSKLIGIITDGDLRRALKKNPLKSWAKLNANNLMTHDPITINSNSLAYDAIKLMEKNRKKPISILPVIDNSQKLVGFLTIHDLIQAGF